ncbi:MAG: metallophosphoesterase family protein [Desulfobulbaceae bacterium]|nr:metallophosphoesterase family protein [Desulfobulbaceae bacterium]
MKAGILSDTHLANPGREFTRLIERCFASCDVIIHAGDLTGVKVLDAFSGYEVHAVHGNMCDAVSSRSLPREKTFQLGNFILGLTHGAHLGPDIEQNLWHLFPEADCMIYGHTHRPVCSRQGGVLIINPGSFRSTGRFGAPGTYAILEIEDSLHATIHEVPSAP